MNPVRMTTGDAGGHTSRMLSMQYTRTHIRVDLSVTVQPDLSPSKGALGMIAYVSNSTKLSGSEKSAIIRLAAFIDEFADGNPKLMKQLAGVVQLMEMTAENRDYAKHSFREGLEEYQKWRERFRVMRGEQGVELTLSFQALIEELRVTYRQGMPPSPWQTLSGTIQASQHNDAHVLASPGRTNLTA